MASIAKGRMILRSISHSRSYGRLSLKAKVLWPLLFVQGDDQGRLSGELDEIKWLACPNVPEIHDDIGQLLKEMEEQDMIILYTAGEDNSIIQVKNWWHWQKPQWAYPSKYPAPDGWVDHLRYRAEKEIVTINWPPLEWDLPKSLPKPLAKDLPEPLGGSVIEDKVTQDKQKIREDKSKNPPTPQTTYPPKLVENVTTYTLELHDDPQNTESNISRVWYLMRNSSITTDDFLILMGKAKHKAREHIHSVQKVAKEPAQYAPGVEVPNKNLWPYFFSCLKELVEGWEKGVRKPRDGL